MSNALTLTDQFSAYHRVKQQNRVRKGFSNQSSPTCPFAHCDQSSSTAAVDVVILVVVLGACAFLFTPYFTYVCVEAAKVVPDVLIFIGEIVIQAPVAYASATFFMFAAVLTAYEIYQYKSRRCDNPHCRGLRKAMELDIQLESEDCVKSNLAVSRELPWIGGMGLGQDQKELEAELRRMAPRNGRAVLIFRAPCGCPAARFEAAGPKKILRRTKK